MQAQSLATGDTICRPHLHQVRHQPGVVDAMLLGSKVDPLDPKLQRIHVSQDS